jgi:hypothetical protein
MRWRDPGETGDLNKAQKIGAKLFGPPILNYSTSSARLIRVRPTLTEIILPPRTRRCVVFFLAALAASAACDISLFEPEIDLHSSDSKSQRWR